MNRYRKQIAEEAWSWAIIGTGVWVLYALVRWTA